MKGFRTTTIEARDQAAKDAGEIKFAISSETPVERWFGIEILRHAPDAIMLERLDDGRHPLLVNHDADKQVGVVTRAKLDVGDKMLRGAARFSRATYAQEIRTDVDDEIRTLISTGYLVHEVEEMERDAAGELAVKRKLSGEQFEREMRELFGEAFYRAGPSAMRAKDPKQDPPTYIVTRWEPFEVSIVPIPADTAVGIGRSADTDSEAGKTPLIQTTRSNPNMDPNKQLTDIELERQRTSTILELGTQYAKWVDAKAVQNAIRSQHTVEQFKDAIMKAMESQAADVSQREIGMDKREIQRYSIGRAIVASLTGDWSKAGLELEASRAVGKLFGMSPEGFFVPFDAWKRDFNLGTSSEAGNLRETQLRTDLYVDALRNAMVLARMGIRVIPGLTGNVDIPRKSVAGTLGMLAEIGSASETNPQTAKNTLSPKRIGAYIEVSKQALIQSAIALEPMLRDDLLTGAGVLIESQIINGVGSNNEMTGIRNQSGIGTVALGGNGGALTWDCLVDLESACANVNAEPDVLAGYLTNTRVRGKAKKVTKSTYLPFIWQDGQFPLNGYRAGITNNVPNNLTKGTSTTICSALLFSSDWSMSVLGLFGAPDVTVDPYTKADTGQVKITLNQFADTTVRQPAAFAKDEDVLTT